MIRFLVAVCLTGLIANESLGGSAGAPGFLEGRLKIQPSRGVDLAGDAQPAPPSANYAEYPLVVLSKDGREEITQIKVNDQGHYRVSLPPGEYLLALKGPSKRARQQRRPFTVVSQKTVRADMDLLADLSVSGAPR